MSSSASWSSAPPVSARSPDRTASISVGPRPAGSGGDARAASSSSRTSLSVVWVKSQYECPTATNGDGVVAQTTSSTSAPSSAAGRLGRRRHGDDDAGRPEAAQGLDGGPHARARGQPVVDEDHRSGGHSRRGPIAAVRALPPHKLAALAVGHTLDDLGRDAQAAHHVIVDHDDAAAGDRAHRDLFVAGDAELADHEDVEGRPESPGDLVGHRDAAARQAEDHDVVAVAEVPEQAPEHPAGVAAVSGRRAAAGWRPHGSRTRRLARLPDPAAPPRRSSSRRSSVTSPLRRSQHRRPRATNAPPDHVVRAGHPAPRGLASLTAPSRGERRQPGENNTIGGSGAGPAARRWGHDGFHRGAPDGTRVEGPRPCRRAAGAAGRVRLLPGGGAGRRPPGGPARRRDPPAQRRPDRRGGRGPGPGARGRRDPRPRRAPRGGGRPRPRRGDPRGAAEARERSGLHGDARAGPLGGPRGLGGDRGRGAGQGPPDPGVPLRRGGAAHRGGGGVCGRRPGRPGARGHRPRLVRSARRALHGADGGRGRARAGDRAPRPPAVRSRRGRRRVPGPAGRAAPGRRPHGRRHRPLRTRQRLGRPVPLPGRPPGDPARRRHPGPDRPAPAGVRERGVEHRPAQRVTGAGRPRDDAGAER